ncbi:MAG: ABC transporter ATP-binding protein [Clostridia bacterium]|nr:ABC transporter ATP-binding protein [Clostridia bacterium]
MLKILKNFRWQYWVLAVVMVAFIVLQVELDLALPEYMSEIIALITIPGSTMEQVWQAGFKMIGISFGSLLCTVVTSFIAARIAAGFGAILRKKIFDKVESFSLEEINKFSTASLITRCTNDVQQILMFITIGLRLLITAPIMAGGAIIKISGKSSELTTITMIGVAVIVVFVVILTLVVMPKFRAIQRLTDNLNNVTRENLTGIRVVRAYNAEGFEEQKFDEVNQKITKTHLFVNRVMSLMHPMMQIVMNGLSLSITWVGATLINANKLTLPVMMSFNMYSMQIVMSFMMLIMVFIFMPRASVSAKRINEVLDTPNSISNPQNPVSANDKKGVVEFKNVSFKYADADECMLKDISFVANKGETVAIIGSTGSGKSSLLSLIPRFYDVTEGQVMVNGIDVKEQNLADLRDKIGYVPQKAILFSGTIESNLRFGNENADKDLLQKAVDIAQATNIVQAKGFTGNVAQGGQNLSGGQKQRMSIARAIAKQPEIYLFDDSFSALDYKTDKLLRQALNKEVSDATKIIVAQRIGTIKNADKILVLDKGKIVGNGTHQQLLQNCEVYREIAQSQLSKEELENA